MYLSKQSLLNKDLCNYFQKPPLPKESVDVRNTQNGWNCFHLCIYGC